MAYIASHTGIQDFFIFKPISRHKPGKYKISNNKTHPLPTKWDGPPPGPVLHLSEPFVDISCGLADGFGEQLRSHKVGAGAGGQIAAVLYQLHAPEIDLPVSLYGLFDGILDLVKAGDPG